MTITNIACALILGILVIVLVNIRGKKQKAAQAAAPAEIKEGASADVLEGLEKLENLCEAGILTEEEFASFKQRAAEKTAAADAASPDNGTSSDKPE